MITIIAGPQGSGKSTKARELTNKMGANAGNTSSVCAPSKRSDVITMFNTADMFAIDFFIIDECPIHVMYLIFETYQNTFPEGTDQHFILCVQPRSKN